MLREYQLTNFKAFAGPETIPIRPITLIYGPNSSGKSSVLQSLLLLKQTLQEAENPEALLLPKGNLVNLGGYREFVHRHDDSKSFSFKFLLDVDKQGFEKLLPKNLIETPLLGLHIAFTYDRQISNVVFSSIKLFIGEDSSPLAIYKPKKRDLVRVELTGFSETILQLDHINYEHSLWQAWWKNFSLLLPWDREQVTKMRFKFFNFNKNNPGWETRLPTELFNIQKSIKNDLERADEQYKEYIQILKKKLSEVESLIQFWQHFEDFSFEKAIEDLSKLTQYSLLASRNFLCPSPS
jgi:AAA15 family ATPase/GTPase